MQFYAFQPAFLHGKHARGRSHTVEYGACTIRHGDLKQISKMIEWDLWHSVCELALRGSYKAAGDQLGVDPTTIKRRKEALERQLGRHLFLRSGGRLVPTPACQAALREIQAAGKLIDNAQNVLGYTGKALTWRKITITSVPYICEELLGPAIARMPSASRLLVELVGQDRNLDISDGRDADIALRLGNTETGDAESWHIADLHYSTYIAKSAPKDKVRWVTLDRSYSQLDEVRIPERFAGANGVGFTASTIGCMMRMIETGAAKGLVPDICAARSGKLMKVDNHPAMSRPLWLIWRADSLIDPYFRSILTWMAQEIVAAMKPTDKIHRLLQDFEHSSSQPDMILGDNA